MTWCSNTLLRTVVVSTAKALICQHLNHIVRVDSFTLMKMIYRGKTKKRFLRFKFSETLFLSYVKAHYCNEKDGADFMKEILQPHASNIIKNEILTVEKKSFVIMDLTKGQMKPVA